ncbi:MAG: hypothetical protein J6Y02_05470 [Pseudobutyrivibrio sp.]|nr:hypothetical protein [Pseudobutyrivibrio sp.]
MSSKIRDDYYNWLVDLTCGWCSRYGNYSNLMSYLYARQFTWTIPHDENRASDGFEMRYRFVEQTTEYTYRDVYLYLTHPTNCLEMMTALASGCEEHIMGDPSIGDNTGFWFYQMIANMHLDQMTDDYFDEDYVEAVVSDMLQRRYKKNGDGGLFIINDPTKDMRTVEIWCQLCWYLKGYM